MQEMKCNQVNIRKLNELKRGEEGSNMKSILINYFGVISIIDQDQST